MVKGKIVGWMNTLLKKTSEHEGGYSSVQENLDGNGVSYGILQWTQRGGGLHKLLSRMRRADPAAFDATMGGRGEALLAHLAQPLPQRMGPLDGELLWTGEWLKRFRKLGELPKMQKAQQEEAKESEYMQAAIEIARILGLDSERALVVFYNRTVHQGAQGALRPARALAEHYAVHGRPQSATTILAQYAWQAARPFRVTNQPVSDMRSDTTRWVRLETERQIDEAGKLQTVRGPVWHAYTGDWDLYDLIMKRTADILADKKLRDQPVDLAVG